MFARLVTRGAKKHILTLLGTTAVVVGLVLPRYLRAEAPATAPSNALASLQEQRIETLQQASVVAHRLFENGITTVEDTMRVDRLLLDAQLEAATTADDRVKLLQKALELARTQEDLISRQQKAGLATPVAPLEAKADRLRIEIRLAELNAK